MDALRARVRDEGYTDPRQLTQLLKEEVGKLLLPSRPGTSSPFELPPIRPQVVLVVGINGVGKTTTIGKLAHEYVRNGSKVVIAAADTFRAAANEQLEIWAERAGAQIIRQRQGSDPAAVAYDSVQAAKARGADVVIVDTAGRLHTKLNLMEELRKIKRVLQKLDPAFPHEVLLVIDASTGQNGLQQAKQFSAAVGVTGLVLTKLDGTAKGGIVLAIIRELKVPVRYIGVGERLGDLQPFDPGAFVEALFER
jgi:fused signal recognition particle receptor